MAEIKQARDDAPERPEGTPSARPDETSGAPGDATGPPRDVTDASTGSAERSGRGFVGSTPFLIIVALAVAILVKTFVIQAFYIPSESMVPTLEVGDRVFVNKFLFDDGDIHRGDVVVFENPNPGELPNRGVVTGFLHWLGEGIGLAQPENEDFIKRVIALPGETIEIRDNVVYIDGKALDEPYLTELAKESTGTYAPHTVPDDALFVMGDNRGNSADSRYGLGFVPVDDVIGKAFVVIWPPSQVGGIG